jgi:hypothetical protein
LGRVEALAVFYINNLGKIIGAGISGLFVAAAISHVSKSKSSSHAAVPRKEETDEDLIRPFRWLALAGDYDVFSAAVLKALPSHPDEDIKSMWLEFRK